MVLGNKEMKDIGQNKEATDIKCDNKNKISLKPVAACIV